MKLSVHIRESEMGGYVAYCPALPGCRTRGRTRRQAQEKLDDAIRGYIAAVNDFVPDHVEQEEIFEA
jgi:predicted RNase H-like HicB family nuclease